MTLVSSNSQSSFQSDFTKSVAALATSIAEVELEDALSRSKNFINNLDKVNKIVFLEVFGVFGLKTRPLLSPPGIKLTNFLRKISKDGSKYSSEINQRISDFGRQVTERLKKHFEEYEYFKSGKASYEIIWVDELPWSGIEVSIWNGPTPQHILNRCRVIKTPLTTVNTILEQIASEGPLELNPVSSEWQVGFEKYEILVLASNITKEMIQKIDTFGRDRINDKISLEIPFNITKEEDVAGLLKYVQSADFPGGFKLPMDLDVFPFKVFLESLAQKKIEPFSPENTGRLIAIGQQVEQIVKEYF